MWNGVDNMDGIGNMHGDLGIYRWSGRYGFGRVLVDMDVCSGYE